MHGANHKRVVGRVEVDRMPPRWLPSAGGEILCLRRRDIFEIVGGGLPTGEREF